ncbi:MAG: tetratricopeptide (TPR) repeat protein [Halieaceae bacterium]
MTGADLTLFRRQSQRALQRRDFAGLRELCRKTRAQLPELADAWFLESVAAEALRDMRHALHTVERALALDPHNSEYLVQKARYHAQVNEEQAAMSCCDKSLALGVTAALQLDTLGVVLTRFGDYARAAEVLRQAVAANAEHPQFRFNLAAAEQFLGNSAAAREQYEAVLRLQPTHARTYWALSELEKNQVDTRHEAAMRGLASQASIGDRDALYLAHALARIEEERGEYGRALSTLAVAKARRRRALAYDFQQDEALFDSLYRSFDGVGPEPIEGCGDELSPLFVAGLPRTGTTLIEQILCAHSAVDSLGELQALPHAIKRLSGVEGPAVLNPAVIEAAVQQQDLALAASYRRSLDSRLQTLGEGTRYFIDKMPLNFLYVGFILERMPDARVVVLHRHPMDAGLSNYRQLFALDYSYYNYSYDLADTGRYVAAFEGLLGHWRQRYGSRLHIVEYESLVADAEPVVRSLLDYLELAWDPACLSFHERRGAVATPSGVQVREPLYNRAVGRWARYGEVLTPLRDTLLAGGVAAREISG